MPSKVEVEITYPFSNFNSFTFSLLHKPETFQESCSMQSNYIWLVLITRLILTHWGRVTHICVGKLTIIGSDNGLSPGQRQAIIWTNAGILLIGPLGSNFREILIEIQTFSFKKMYLKMSSAKWRPFCLRLNVLRMNTSNLHTIHFTGFIDNN